MTTNREDIISMAREASIEVDWSFDFHMRLEHFAALVAAAEREACAALVDANAMACTSPLFRSLLQSNADAIRARGQDPMPLFADWNKDWQK